MRFYIYKYISNAWTWVEVGVEVEPNLTKAWDTTNDTFSCVLGVNSDAEPYKPMTPFKITDDNGQNTIMWIITDMVSVFSVSPQVYKHELTIVQYRYFLNKHLLRNTVFNQPKIKNQKLYTAVNSQYIFFSGYGYYYAINNDNGSVLSWTDKITINPHSKIKDGSFDYCFYYVRGTDEVDGNSDPVPVTLTKLTNDVFGAMNSKLRTNVYIRICDANNSDAVIYSFRPFNLQRNTKQQLPTAMINAINSYITSRGNDPVKIYAKYDAGLDTGESFVDNSISQCFLRTIDTTLQNEVPNGTDIFKPIVLQINLDFNVYNYTMYDVLSTLLKQYRMVDYYGNAKRKQLFNLPASGELYDLLTTTFPPDTLSFTQATFYDVLTEIFRFYDAGFKFDENQTLQIEYYNDYQAERNDIQFSGKSLSFGEQNYNNSKIVYYQNSLQEIKIPKIQVRTESLGVPEQTDYAIVLPKPIYDISKLTVRISSSSSVVLCNSNGISNFAMDLDLTYFVVNKDIWSVLDSTSSNPLSFADYTKLYQEGSIPYTRGSKSINVSTYHKDWAGIQNTVMGYVTDLALRRFFGQPGYQSTVNYTQFNTAMTAWHTFSFSIEYKTLNNGRLQTETLDDQYDGEMLVNQGNGIVDINKLGLNILGESLKDGQPTLTATCELTDWDNRIREGDYIIYNGSRWIANVVTYKAIKDDVYSVTVQFSKNFNALSLRVATDNEKRLTAISSEHATMSEDSYIDYVYVTDGGLAPTRETIVLGTSLESIVGQTFGKAPSVYPVQNIDGVAVSSYGENNQLNIFGDLGWGAANIIAPLVKYGSGNSLCFEVQFDSPSSAGNALIYSGGKYRSYAILYTDDEGWADLIDVRFYQKSGFILKDYPVLDNSSTNVGEILRLRYYKKPNEIFGLNYQIAFLPILSQINNFFVGNAFIKNNAFVDNKKIPLKFYLYYDDSYKYSVLDTKGHLGNRVEVSFSTNPTTGGIVRLYIYLLTSSIITAKSWAICDENGDIYFASNNQKVFTNNINTTTAISFCPRRSKMTEQDGLYGIPGISLPTFHEFTISPEEWSVLPAIRQINVGKSTPDSYINEGGGIITAVFNYSYQSLILVGKTMETGFPQITQDGAGGYTNTVSFDSATGTFSGKIYLYDYHSGDSGSATITYKTVGQLSYYFKDFIEQVPELVSTNVSNILITPLSDVSGITNTISYNSATGTFTGRVYKSAEPTADITYTITYTIS